MIKDDRLKDLQVNKSKTHCAQGSGQDRADHLDH